MQRTPVFYPRGYFPPKTNAERQRAFRQRNPDYYRILQAKRRAGVRARGERQRIMQRTLLRMPDHLMLPAPVETIEIPGMTILDTSNPLADRQVQHAELRT